MSKLIGEQLQVVDEKGKIRHFETPELLLEYFVKYRLNKYNDRKTKLITIKEQQLKENTALCKFIDLVTSNKLKINNRPIDDIKQDMDKYELSHELLKIQVSKLTKEEKEELSAALNASYAEDGIEIEVKDGLQPVYSFIISVE